MKAPELEHSIDESVKLITDTWVKLYDGPMDCGDVEDVAFVFQNKLDWNMGNLTEDEYINNTKEYKEII